MEPIKISISVELNLSEETKKFITSVLGGKVAALAPQPAPIPVPAAPAPQPAPTPVPAAPAPAKPAVVNPTESAAPTINIETVRQALAAKVNNHREEIKAKLNELGSPSVTKLNPEKYGEMLNFLNSLS